MSDRLTLAFAAALLSGFIVFSVILIVILRLLEQHFLDQDLLTTNRAIAAIVEIRDSGLSVEASDQIQFRSLAAHTNALVVTTAGKILLSSGGSIPQILRAWSFTGDAKLLTIDDGEQHLRVSAIPLKTARHRLGLALTWQSVSEFTALERLAIFACVAAVLLISVPAIFASRLIAKRHLRPLEKITQDAAGIESHHSSRRLNVSGRNTIEIDTLTTTINRMLDRLDQAYLRQQQFTADASHELRTPLAVILAEAELALRGERERPAYQAAFTTISEVGVEMQNLLEKLLHAARCEVIVEPIVDVLDLIALIDLVQSRLRKVAQTRRVHLQYRGPQQALVRGSAEAILHALHAVIDNGIKYAQFGGEVSLEIHEIENRTILSVRDDGPGFSPAALEHGLERFWRDDASRPSDGGVGLGLFLAATVLVPSAATLRLRNDHGAVVDFEFHRAAADLI